MLRTLAKALVVIAAFGLVAVFGAYALLVVGSRSAVEYYYGS